MLDRSYSCYITCLGTDSINISHTTIKTKCKASNRDIELYPCVGDLPEKQIENYTAVEILNREYKSTYDKARPEPSTF